MWDEPDRIVQTVANRGLHLAQVNYQPKWASTRVIYPATSLPDHLSDWTEFMAAIATRYAGRIRPFGTMTAELLELGHRLAEKGVTHVALESTGVYWHPVVRHEALFDREGMKGPLHRRDRERQSPHPDDAAANRRTFRQCAHRSDRSGDAFPS